MPAPVPHLLREGNIVKLEDGLGNPLTAFVILDRGYTGKEHLLGVALIHMNGRLYDPKLHRFLSPDNYIPDPFDTQSYNRYAYVFNNPLSHIDPDGEVPVLVFVGAAIIGGGANVWSNWDKIKKDPWSAVGYFLSGAAGGAVSVVNPFLGGAITAKVNIATDIAFGNLPNFEGFEDVAWYIGGKALDGLGAAGAGGLSKAGYNFAVKVGWVNTVTYSGIPTIVSGTATTSFGVLAPDVVLTTTKTTILEPLGKIAVNQAAKTGSSFFQGTKYTNKVLG